MKDGLAWGSIVRLGLVQSALGAIVMLTNSLLNRIMVVEYALAAAIPAGLVAWHYALQLTRPKWGHSSDCGHRRTPWIVGGMAVLALGALLATDATLVLPNWPATGFALGLVAYSLIGAGVGACGTSLLAMLATHVSPERRPAAAAMTWIMMIIGIIVTAITVGALLDPYSPARLLAVVCGVVSIAFLITVVAVYGVEQHATADRTLSPTQADFTAAVRSVWRDRAARHFSLFIFVSMLAYSMQDMILEPMAGLVFGLTPGQSTSLSGVQHGGVLAGMLFVGLIGGFGRTRGLAMRRWIVGGCLGSAIALLAICLGIFEGPGWPLEATAFALGFANGVFAVAAISSMMDLAGTGGGGSEGLRIGVWGAAQAIAFGSGIFIGAAGLDIARSIMPTGQAFATIFLIEALLFVVAAIIALGIGNRAAQKYQGTAALA